MLKYSETVRLETGDINLCVMLTAVKPKYPSAYKIMLDYFEGKQTNSQFRVVFSVFKLNDLLMYIILQ